MCSPIDSVIRPSSKPAGIYTYQRRKLSVVLAVVQAITKPDIFQVSTAPATPCENFHPHVIAVNTSGSQPDVSSFTHRRQVLEGLVTARSNQPERATGNNLATSDGDEPIIPKPKGQAAKDFNLCVRMGLSKSTKGLQSYNTLIVR